MAPRFAALIDLNVIMDVLLCRQPFFEPSARVLAAVESGAVQGWIAAHSVTTLFYLISRSDSAEHARVVLGELPSILSVTPVDETIRDALALPYADFEDAVQMAAAVHCGAGYLVTRNVADFAGGPLPSLQPAEFIALL